MREERIMISGKVSIGATIAYPDDEKNELPAVLIIAGMGKCDRDGNNGNDKTDFYKTLSEMFIINGLVTIRYDKRGTYESKVKTTDIGLKEYKEDAIAVYNYLKSDSRVNNKKIILCGHDEGSIIATLIAKKTRSEGMILLGNAGTSLKESMFYQSRVMAEQAKLAKGISGWILRKQVSEGNPALQVDALFEKARQSKKEVVYMGNIPMNARWLREHNEYTNTDIMDMIEEYKRPVLAITGKKDLESDYRSLGALEHMQNVTVCTPNDVNHVMKEVQGSNLLSEAKKQYRAQALRPLAGEVRNSIVEFIKKM